MHINFKGTLTHHQEKTHVVHPFDVPAGMVRLELQMAYQPVQLGRYLPINEISISLFSPEGFRGARHNNRDLNVSLSAAAATPGYLAGPIPPGTWQLVIDVHRILPGSVVDYDVIIRTSETVTEPPQESIRNIPRRQDIPRPGWYRGDFHAHSYHSDASWSVGELFDFDKRKRLDFAFLTDHNTTSGLAEWLAYADELLLTLPGSELTTFHGHALALGLTSWIDWRTTLGPQAPTIETICQSVEAQDGVFVIAHPLSLGSPWCAGCAWQYPTMTPGTARCVEVWNGPWAGEANNAEALELFYLWLNQGHRLVATAGTDSHSAARDHTDLGFNLIYAAALTQGALLSGLRQGNSYLSSGPELSVVSIDKEGKTYSMGSSLPATSARLEIRWRSCEPADVIRIIHNGDVLQEFDQKAGSATLTALTPGWLTTEIRRDSGVLRALSNPVYLT